MSDQRVGLERQPWIYFSIFLATSVFLTYGPATLGIKVLVFVIGFLLPVFWACRRPSGGETENIFQCEFLPVIPLWILMLAVLLAVALRFWKLTTFGAWLSGDDSTVGILILDLLKKWNWKFFRGYCELPPLDYWQDYWAYRVTGSPFLGLWFWPAFFSALSVPLSYGWVRRSFSRSFSIVFVGLVAFSYWPLFMGRWGIMSMEILSWEGFAFYLCVSLWNASPDARSNRRAFWLGVWTALGAYLFPPVCLIPAVVIFASQVIGSWRQKRYFGTVLFVSGAIVTLAPFLFEAYREEYGHHVANMGFWHGGLKDQVVVFVKYWLMLFGNIEGSASGVSSAGGVLNPILSAFCFLGVAEVVRKPYAKWVFLVFFLLMAPGFLSASIDLFRIIQVFPLLLILTVLGFQCLLRVFSFRTAMIVGSALFLASAAVDLYRVWEPYSNIARDPDKMVRWGKSPERYKAFQILERVQAQFGPGYIWTDFIPEGLDESLPVATYPFNVALNPDLKNIKPRWMAIFTEAHYLPFLIKRFPDARMSFLSEDHEKGSILVIVPLKADGTGCPPGWLEAYRFFMELNTRTIEARSGQSNRPFIEKMEAFYPELGKDPFLQSVYLEKYLLFYWREKIYRPFDPLNDIRNYSRLIEAGFSNGYQDDFLREKVARVLIVSGKYPQAEKLIQKTLRSDPQNILAMRDLGLIRALRSGKVRLGPNGFETRTMGDHEQ